ncbi:hypothetical protein RMATCC62417_06139 [Rhizopus microsporus]|nr:hypothetical protein RMATCC62417_06139 [Rhizopus microsporus]
MSSNTRRIVTNARTVSYSSGGLNERFANLEKSKKPTHNPAIQSKSVFSRIKADSPKPKSIQQRLGKPVDTRRKPAMAGRITKPNKKPARQQPQKKQQQKPKNDKKGTKQKKKPLSQEDLDKSLDAYMMKDPKTAQAKLDEELTTYMQEAELEEETL